MKPSSSTRPTSTKHSVVLDPLHTHPRYSSRNPRDSKVPPPRADNARGRLAASAAHDISESTMIREDSELTDVNHPERDIEVETDDDNDDAAKGAGVLGMLYQFSKAQTEKGAGVNI